MVVVGGDNSICNERKCRRKCSNFTRPELTCYTLEQLLEIVKEWNKTSKQIIELNNKTSNDKEYIWKELKSRFANTNEEEWINIMNSDIKKEYKKQFAPKIEAEWRKNKNAWLSDEDINKVLASFENQFEGFHYLDSSPIDFDKKDSVGRCKISDLCNYTYNELADNYKTFGIVFNTDPSYKSGQHWIALFIQLQEGKIFFFDSTGSDPPKEVFVLMNRLGMEAKDYFNNKKGIKVEILVNKRIHQKGNTECGVYCLVFIYHMVKTGDFELINKARISDDKIETLRGFFYDDIYKIYEK